MLKSLQKSATALPDYGLTRKYPTVKGHAVESYLDFCDQITLFYDAFYSHDGKYLVLVGPPPLGFEKQLSLAKFFFKGKLLKSRIRKLKQACEVWVSMPHGVKIEEVQLELNGKISEIKVSENLSSRFSGRKVLSSLCKDTPVEWIMDWLRFHVANHGVDALILFENGDKPDHAARVHQAIMESDLDIELEIVHVPFKFGPPHIYDLMFLQVSLLQLIRWKYLQEAEAILCCDIDELIISEDGKPVFDHLKNSFLGYYLIAGIWIEAVLDGKKQMPHNLEGRRHHMFCQTAKPAIRTTRKWIARPNSIPKRLQFKIHGVRPEPKYVAWLHPLYARLRPFLKGAKLCHFMAISTSWKDDRTEIMQKTSDDYVQYDALIKAFKKAFPNYS